MAKTALITGITGQDGSYLAELLLYKGYDVHGIIRRSSSFNTGRIDHVWKDLHIHYGDLSEGGALTRLITRVQPDEVYNLGAMSHVKVSFEVPEYTADVTGVGSLRLLEAIREVGNLPRIYQASSSEMFGSALPPQNEATPFHPRSPYGCAKVFAYWSTVNYREAYKLHASNGILFNHECVTEETPIIFRRAGLVDIAEIKDLVPHRADPRGGKKYQTVPRGVEIWDGTRWSRVTCATATWNGGDKEVFQVEARGGLYRATGDHVSFLAGRIEKNTSGLRAGDELQLYSLPKMSPEVNVSLDEAKFLGRMAGDGYICPEGGSARFTNLDPPLLADTAALFRRITGGTWREDLSKRSGFTGEAVPSVEFSDASEFFRLWRRELYNDDRMKKVPRRILNSSPEIMRAFLSGYNDADGLKAGNFVNREFKSFKTNSALLAQGLCFLCENLGYRVSTYFDRGYYSLNIGLENPVKGRWLQKALNEVRKVGKIEHSGWLFDLATESGTFSAGVGRTWVHNSPRRGETFVTRKITKAVARIVKGWQKEVLLGNLDAKRDWGFAGDYVEAMWKILQHSTPDDYVIATGEAHSVREFCQEAFSYVGLDWEKYVRVDSFYFRPTEVDYLLGDPSKAKRVLNWTPKVAFKQLVRMMVDHDLETQHE